jgi:hypothetical protein
LAEPIPVLFWRRGLERNASCSVVVTPCAFSCSAEKALIAIGTSWIRSDRRCAVTTMSWMPP